MMDTSARFLLVEDDDDHAELITLGLLAAKRAPKTVVRVRDGEEALAYLRRRGAYADSPRPSVILLDLKLPRVSGHEVLAAIKSDPGLCSIPVIVLTTSRALEDRVEAYSCHANSYLTKPTNFGDFTRLIQEVCSYWGVWNQSPGEELEPLPPCSACRTAEEVCPSGITAHGDSGAVPNAVDSASECS